MNNIGERITIKQLDVEMQYELVNIDKEDDEYPYECYPVAIVEKAKEIASSQNKNYRDIILFSEYYDEFVDERLCLSEIYFENCKHDSEIKKYKTALTSLINAIDEELYEFEDKMNIFRRSGITSEEFRAFGYDSIACQLEDTEG
jgi:hypothetical protein